MASVMDLVEVSWWDAQDHDDSWVDPKDAEDFNDKLYEVKSIGYLVRRTEKYITIAGDVGTDGAFGRVEKIPMGMVQSVATLKVLT